MAKKKTETVSINDLIQPDGAVLKRQAAVAHMLNLNRAQQILVASMAEDPFFNAGDPANGGVQFKGQTAKDILGAVVKVMADKEAETRDDLEKMGVKFDDAGGIDRVAGAGLAPKPNRKARRGAAKRKR